MRAEKMKRHKLIWPALPCLRRLGRRSGARGSSPPNAVFFVPYQEIFPRQTVPRPSRRKTQQRLTPLITRLAVQRGKVPIIPPPLTKAFAAFSFFDRVRAFKKRPRPLLTLSVHVRCRPGQGTLFFERHPQPHHDPAPFEPREDSNAIGVAAENRTPIQGWRCWLSSPSPKTKKENKKVFRGDGPSFLRFHLKSPNSRDISDFPSEHRFVWRISANTLAQAMQSKKKLTRPGFRACYIPRPFPPPVTVRGPDCRPFFLSRQKRRPRI